MALDRCVYNDAIVCYDSDDDHDDVNDGHDVYDDHDVIMMTAVPVGAPAALPIAACLELCVRAHAPGSGAAPDNRLSLVRGMAPAHLRPGPPPAGPGHPAATAARPEGKAVHGRARGRVHHRHGREVRRQGQVGKCAGLLYFYHFFLIFVSGVEPPNYSAI